jgi:hypothetical protein
MSFPEQSYKDELKCMDNRLIEMEDKIDLIDTKLTQVVDAILGNPLTKTGGFMHDIEIIKLQIQELERKQLRYEEFKKKITWAIGVIVAIGAIVQYITSIYANVKPN